MPIRNEGLIGAAAAAWGSAGLSALLILAIYRLSRISVASLDYAWNFWHWAVFVVNILFMAYSEAYRGFQLSFSPRSAARALYLYRHPRLVNVLLAPLFCAGYFEATRRTMMVTRVGTIAIIILVLLVQMVPQPWRGIIDAGVVVGLSWGVLSLWYLIFRTFKTGLYPCSPEVPDMVPEQT